MCYAYTSERKMSQTNNDKTTPPTAAPKTTPRDKIRVNHTYIYSRLSPRVCTVSLARAATTAYLHIYIYIYKQCAVCIHVKEKDVTHTNNDKINTTDGRPRNHSQR